MSTILYLIIMCKLFSISAPTSKQEQKTEPLLREVKNKTLIPEGIAVHPATGEVYLSSLHENKIVVVNANGTTSDLISGGQNGFMWGLGMKFSDDGKILWACSSDGNGKTALFKIDVRNKKVLDHFSHDSARFLNDLVILTDGIIYITDTEKSTVFKLESGQLKPWLTDKKLKWANGIAISGDERYLFAASGRYGLQRIDLASKTITSATGGKRTDYAIDGLVYHNNKLYAAIGWPQHKTEEHRILRYSLDKELNFINADTLAINRSYINCITTLAIHKEKLFAIGNTNLGVYNRHQQKTESIMDSLRNPMVSVFHLR